MSVFNKHSVPVLITDQCQPRTDENDYETESHANVVLTYAADANHVHLCDYAIWSYSATPTGGRLTVEDGSGNIVQDVDITAAGPGFLPVFFRGVAINTALIVTLYDGGSGIVGKLTVLGHRMEGA